MEIGTPKNGGNSEVVVSNSVLFLASVMAKSAVTVK
jgi:hypothetical protein